MKKILLKAGVALMIFIGMWLLLVAAGSAGQVGAVELTIWLAMLVAAEVYALRWVADASARSPASGATLDSEPSDARSR